MNRVKKIARWFADIVEVHIPVITFVMLFCAFLLNVFFRYIVGSPQNWTFEFSVNSFVVVGLLGGCIAYRKEDHVVFDLVYSRLSLKGQNILRMISYTIIIVAFSIALPPSILYLWKLRTFVTPIMKIPVSIFFSSFPLLLFSTVLRSIYRLSRDIAAFRAKVYVQSYNTDKKDSLI
ncbi:TRAP transporter small permease subunit [Marispirochaeta aestuarii]|uniref:TRAP transporter small permease n=1 Tax=Marispirochaeta aestuarii TaxID=1963862 RepID=UPI0029C60E17|nr:TRAP transporter small permease subunit [Marispirochaeta aestuarii]